MDNIDNKIKKLWAKIGHRKTDGKRPDCPDEEQLTLFVDGCLSEDGREQVENHLADCSDCLDLVLVHEKVRQSESEKTVEDAPLEWIKKAIDLVPVKEKSQAAEWFDVVLQFAKETVEVLKNPGDLFISLEAIPLAVRGKEKIKPAESITLQKTFPDLNVEIEIERSDIDQVAMAVLTKSKDSEAFQTGLRVSLFNPTLEIASSVSEKGMVHFPDLKYGKYVIKISKRGNELGRVSLDLKE